MAISTAAGQVDELLFDSASSLLDASGGELTDDTVAAVWREDSATNTDADGAFDVASYGLSASTS